MYQGAGSGKKKKKISRFARRPKDLAAVPIYIFYDSEEKVEFKARIKPCSHQLNCIQFLL